MGCVDWIPITKGATECNKTTNSCSTTAVYAVSSNSGGMITLSSCVCGNEPTTDTICPTYCNSSCSVCNSPIFQECNDYLATVGSSTTTAVCYQFWQNATTQLQNDDIIGLVSDEKSLNALNQLSQSTAGFLLRNESINEIKESQIKNAVTFASYFILSNVERLKNWWNLGKKIQIITSKNKDIYGNASVSSEEESRYKIIKYHNGYTYINGVPYSSEEQWVFSRGHSNISTQITKYTETDSPFAGNSKLDLNINMNNTSKPYDYTIEYQNIISLEIAYMNGMIKPNKNPEDLIKIEDIVLSSENVIAKTGSKKYTTSISAAHQSVGLVTIVFLED